MKVFKNFKTAICILLCAMILVPLALPAKSEGSKQLVANQGTRPCLEYNIVDKQAGADRITVINVYMKEGETLYFGSSVATSRIDQYDTPVTDPKNAPLTGCDIMLDTPDGTRHIYDVKTVGAPGNNDSWEGYIKNYAQETAGPKYEYAGETRNPDGYEPFAFQADAEGIYQLRFHSIMGMEKGTDNKAQKNVPLHYNEDWVKGSTEWQGNSTVAAWDATVVGTDGEVKSGRAFTKCLKTYTLGPKEGSNWAELNSKLYVVTADGFTYSIDYNGMNPQGFMFFANNRGLVSTEDNYPVYQSYSSYYKKGGANTDQLDDMIKNQKVTFQNPDAPDTELDKTYNIFFDVPDPDLEGVLYPYPIEPEKPTDLEFVGSGEGSGGYFNFNITNAVAASVTIDMTAIGGGVVELKNAVVPGKNSFYWDGKDEFGNVVPQGEYDSDHIKVTVASRHGEIHFPLIDVEQIPNGIKIERVGNIYRRTDNGLVNVADEYTEKTGYIYYDNETRSAPEILSQHHANYATNKHNKIGDGLNFKEDGVDSTNGALIFTTYNPGDAYTGYGDQTTIDIWSYLYLNTTIELNKPLVIGEKTTSFHGKVFYDSKCDDLNATNNEFKISEGDFALSGLPVELKCTYILNGEEKTVTVATAYTDQLGEYHFLGVDPKAIECDHGTSLTYSVTVTPPMDSYMLTTSSTNGGSETQLAVIDPEEFEASYDLADVGYHFDALDKKIIIKKSWITASEEDTDRPDSIELTLAAYYLGDDGKEILAHEQSVVLDAAGSWQRTLTNLPASELVDGEAKDLIYRLSKEEYTLAGGTTSYTARVNDNGEVDSNSNPYTTEFTESSTTDSITLEARNERSAVTPVPTVYNLRIDKVGEDGQKPLTGAEFTLYSDENCEKPISTVTTEMDGEKALAVFSSLDAGVYYLKETAAPSGYICPTNVMRVNLSENKDEISITYANGESEIELTPVIDEDNNVTIQIANMMALSVPSTGSDFSALTVVMIGVILCAAALAVLCFSRKSGFGIN